eukprot:403365226
MWYKLLLEKILQETTITISLTYFINRLEQQQKIEMTLNILQHIIINLVKAGKQQHLPQVDLQFQRRIRIKAPNPSFFQQRENKDKGLIKSAENNNYFFNQAEKIQDNKIQTHKNSRRFLGVDNVNLGNEIEAAVQTYYPELMSSTKKNFVEFINKEQVEFMKRKMNTDLFQLVDVTKLKKKERTKQLQKIFNKYEYILEEQDRKKQIVQKRKMLIQNAIKESLARRNQLGTSMSKSVNDSQQKIAFLQSPSFIINNDFKTQTQQSQKHQYQHEINSFQTQRDTHLNKNMKLDQMKNFFSLRDMKSSEGISGRSSTILSTACQTAQPGIRGRKTVRIKTDNQILINS